MKYHTKINMRFVHIADLHFDIPFRTLSSVENLPDSRRLEQREALRKVIEYIKENEIEYLFIAGDLYEHKYIRQTNIEYINNLFKQVPNTRIFIAPGNHDPYIVNSYYAKYPWNENVHIFDGKWSKVELKECDIYGVGFEDFYCEKSLINNIEVSNKEKINVLVTHGSLDQSQCAEFNYNPIKSNDIKELQFDYVALGHIHKNNVTENGRIIYPGSLISFGFDELGKHGMVVGELTKEKIKLEFKEIDNREFKEEYLQVDNLFSQEDLVEAINDIKTEANDLYKIILTGNRNIIIDLNTIKKIISNKNILKIKDYTKLKYNLEEIANDFDLKGIFTKLMSEKLDNADEHEKEVIERAIEIGLEVFENNEENK